MLKKRDDEMQTSSDSDVFGKRVKMRAEADVAVKTLNPLRGSGKSRNAMWLSLMLLQIGCVGHLVQYSESDGEVLVVIVVGAIMVFSCYLIVNNVQQFRAQYAVPTGSTPALPWWPKIGTENNTRWSATTRHLTLG
eukprot:6811328-Prymnesium_polylepis.1